MDARDSVLQRDFGGVDAYRHDLDQYLDIRNGLMPDAGSISRHKIVSAIIRRSGIFIV